MKETTLARFKTLAALLLLLFLFASIVVIVSNISEVRDPRSKAAAETVIISADFDGYVGGGCDDSGSVVQIGGSVGVNYRGYIRFPLSSLPSNLVVTDVKLKVRVTKAAGALDNIQAYNKNGLANPASDSCNTRRDRAGNDSTPYVTNHSFPLSLGLKIVDLGSDADGDIEAARKAAINRFSLGFRKTVEDGTADHFLEAVGAGSDEPRLIITYNTIGPPPPPPGNGGDTGSGNGSSGGSGTNGTSEGGTTGTGGITETISSLKVYLNPPSFLVGKLDALLKVKGTKISKKIQVSSSSSSFTIPTKDALHQGQKYTLVFSGKKFVDKKIAFKASTPTTTVSVGNLVFGDIDGSEKVNSKDLSLLSTYMVEADRRADLKLDQAINALDYSVLLTGLINKGKVEKRGGDTNLSFFITAKGSGLEKDFTVDILADTPGVSSDGVDILLTYDTSMVYLKKVMKSSAYSEFPFLLGSDGKVQITALARKDEPNTGLNVVATLIFEAIKEGDTKIEYTVREPLTTDSNIAGRLSGSDILTTVDSLNLDIGSDDIVSTIERVEPGRNTWIAYLAYSISLLLLFGGFLGAVKRFKRIRKERLSPSKQS